MRKRSRKFTAITLFIVVIACVACNREQTKEKLSSETAKVERKQEEDTSYEVFSKPKEALSKSMLGMFLFNNENEPYFIFLLKENNGYLYKECRLGADNKWGSSVTKWSDKLIKEEKVLIETMVSKKQGVYYCIAADIGNQKEKYLYRITREGDIKKLNIEKANEKMKGLILTNLSILSDNELVLSYTGDEMDMELEEGIDSLCYHVVNEEVIGEPVKLMDYNAEFDDEKLYYSVAAGQEVVVGRSLDSTLPKRVIKCENLGLLEYSPIVISNGFGYTLSEKGIIGGELTAKKWDIVMPRENMKYSSSIPNLPSAIACMIKTPGEDKEFYCMTWKNIEMTDFEWVHYSDET